MQPTHIIFDKNFTSYVLLFCGIISSVSEEAGCSYQQNVKNTKLNFGLIASFLEFISSVFNPTPEELFCFNIK